jgi:hypothetical protein
VHRPENVDRDGALREHRGVLTPSLRHLVGLAALIAPAIHVLSNLMEVLGGRFSASQLWINYASFMVLPFVMVGLHVAQRALGGWPSLAGALLYGSSFVYFAGTTQYALVRKIPHLRGPARGAGADLLDSRGAHGAGRCSVRFGYLARGGVPEVDRRSW